LFALALGCLHQKEDSLEFSVHFNDVTTSSRNGGSQYTVLHEARARLTQPLITHDKSKGKRRSDAIPLFTIITLDEGTSLVTGQFNPILKEYLLGLAGKFTTVELESLLTLTKCPQSAPVLDSAQLPQPDLAGAYFVRAAARVVVWGKFRYLSPLERLQPLRAETRPPGVSDHWLGSGCDR
jgi:hypothetical protein